MKTVTTAAEAQSYLHKHIPLSAAMAVQVVSLDVAESGVHLFAPLAPNVNHQHTVFGGSITSVATLACWTLVWAGLREAELDARTVIARGATEYLTPVSGDFDAVCLPPAPGDWGKFLHTLQRKKRARISLTATLTERSETKAGATFTGDFVALLTASENKKTTTDTVSDGSVNPVVKLQLSVSDFDVDKWQHQVTHSEPLGIRFTTLAELGDTEANRKRLYELNKECSADIPGRGPFYSYAEYCQKRLDVDSFTASGVILALHGEEWVGMAAVSYRTGQDFVFNEMTGVVRSWRRRGIATSLKILSLQFAQSLGVAFIYTLHATANVAAIAMNCRLGYTELTVLVAQMN